MNPALICCETLSQEVWEDVEADGHALKVVEARRLVSGRSMNTYWEFRFRRAFCLAVPEKPQAPSPESQTPNLKCGLSGFSRTHSSGGVSGKRG